MQTNISLPFSFKVGLNFVLLIFVFLMGQVITSANTFSPQEVTKDESITFDSQSGLTLASNQSISLTLLGTYATGLARAAETVAFDPLRARAYVSNRANRTIDILDISDPTKPTLVAQIDISPYGHTANSIAFINTTLVAAVSVLDEADNRWQLPGKVIFLDGDGNLRGEIEVGYQPEMLIFSPDGQYLLVANEGEPNDRYDIDPSGSVTIIPRDDDLIEVDFTAFDGREAELRARGVRIYPGHSVSSDVEPEYIAISPDSNTAFVTLQENNAIAVIDIASATVVDILPLGVKDHSRGQPTLTQYILEQPVLGTTKSGQEILLGGLSGLFLVGQEDGVYHFVTIPDRGPSPDLVDGKRPFALPDYQARIVHLALDMAADELSLVDETMLYRDVDGEAIPISGISNIPQVDEPPVDLYGEALAYDPFGGYFGGITVNPTDKSYWVVDKYRPAIYHFDAKGMLINRLIPQEKTLLPRLTAIGPSKLPVGTLTLPPPPKTLDNKTLPVEYSNRRRNRGFEGIALDPDSSILYTFIQIPLANPDHESSDNSNIIRILGIDPSTGEPVAEYVYLLENPTYSDSNVDKIGDAVYAGNGQFYVIERDSAVVPFSKKFIFKIDLKGATNILGLDTGDKPLEQHRVDEMIALGIQPVHKIKLTNLPSIGYMAGNKPEGLALLPDGSLAVINDNDFGLAEGNIPFDGTVLFNPNPSPIVLGIISFPKGNTLDVSDRDGGINLQNWPVLGMYQPDAIVAYETADGLTYFVTANEGEARDNSSFSETLRIADLTLDAVVFPDAETLLAPENLGRLATSRLFGDLDDDGDHDVLYSYGTRSFSIWDVYGNLVYDSGDDFELATMATVPDRFNANNGDPKAVDAQSDDKGPEPAGLALAEIDGHVYIFVGLEHSAGGVMIYDITDPIAPIFIGYEPAISGDISPEGLIYIAAEDNPTEQPLLIVANKFSGSTTIYGISLVDDIVEETDEDSISVAAVLLRLLLLPLPLP